MADARDIAVISYLRPKVEVLRNHALTSLVNDMPRTVRQIEMLFVRSLLQAKSSLLWTPVLRPYVGPMR